jgi:2-oxoisovalerate dehydrogenase E1 component
MLYQRKNLSDELLTEIYKRLLYPRLIEEKMLLLLRQGKISKWFSGIGQEAIAAGTAFALKPNEWVMPLHRNLGVFTGRNMPLHKLFMQWQGNYEGYSKGRERSFHFGSAEHHICGMISHLGPQLAVADGVALAYKLKQENKVSVAFSGEGGTSEGDFHEALNLAAVWDLPVIFIVENNGYALSTPTHEQFRCNRIADKAGGYGIEAVTIDGNNILTVIDTISGVREYCIEKQKPYLIECMTFRMRGHEEASGTKYVPQHLLEQWKQQDPISNYEIYLQSIGLLPEAKKAAVYDELKRTIEHELSLVNNPKPIIAGTENELRDVYAPYKSPKEFLINTLQPALQKRFVNPNEQQLTALKGEETRFVDAISQALKQCMEKDEKLVLMGQDIAEYGGAFKVTEGFVQIFGKDRVRNTPLCESAVIGAALGLSLQGYRSVVEMQFSDFISVGFNQVVNNLAKIYYRWGQPANVVIRMPTGAGVGAGPFHSQSTEAWFAHVPGLKVVYPATPYDAKGLLIAAINDPNPVLYFEHKALYRSVSGPMPANYYEVEIGKASVVSKGGDIAIITYGAGVHWAKEYAGRHKEISFYILDLRSLLPLDFEAVKEAVKATGKVLVLHEDTLTGGIGAEISAWITEHCFSYLDAPVLRCASLDTPIPFNIELEKNFLAKERIHEYVTKLISF